MLRPARGYGDDTDNVTTLLAEHELADHGLAAEVVDTWSTENSGRSP